MTTTTTTALIVIIIIIIATSFVVVPAAATEEAYAQMIVEYSPYDISAGGPLASINEDSKTFLENYLISVIRNNLTSNDSADMIMTLDGATGKMRITSNSGTPSYVEDDITILLYNTPFKITNGYKFQNGELIASNGTKLLSR